MAIKFTILLLAFFFLPHFPLYSLTQYEQDLIDQWQPINAQVMGRIMGSAFHDEGAENAMWFIARQHPELVEQAILTNPVQTSWNGFEVYRQIAFEGLVTPESYANTLLNAFERMRLEPKLSRFNLFRDRLITHLEEFSFDPQTASAFTTLPKHYENIAICLKKQRVLSFILNNGILNSLLKKLENSQNQVENGQKKVGIQTLQAALNEISAQKGKHITEDGADILDGYIKNLIAHIESGQP